MKQYKNISGFTLIELIVSITIFSIVMVSVISIFLFASQLSWKIEINRAMQENSKNVIETIAEDIRKNGIKWVSPSDLDPWSCGPAWFTGGKEHGNKLCTGTSEYYIAKESSGGWVRVNPVTECDELKENDCRIVRKYSGDIFPLTNSHITFRTLDFYIAGDQIPKVTVTFLAQPAVKKNVQADLIKENEFYFQTSISGRLIDIQ